MWEYRKYCDRKIKQARRVFCHSYQFRNAKRVGLQELGPRFTLRPRYLQKGTFDSKNGEYYWMFKVCF